MAFSAGTGCCSSPAEYAVLSPEREDYLRAQIAHRLGFRAAPVCTCEIDSREAGTMRKLIFGMNVTLDGYIAATGDDIGWSGGDAGAPGGARGELFPGGGGQGGGGG